MVKELNEVERTDSDANSNSTRGAISDTETRSDPKSGSKPSSQKSSPKTVNDVKKAPAKPAKKPATFKDTTSIAEAELVEAKKPAVKASAPKAKAKSTSATEKTTTLTEKMASANEKSPKTPEKTTKVVEQPTKATLKKSPERPPIKVKTLGEIAEERERAAKKGKKLTSSKSKAASSDTDQEIVITKPKKALRKKRPMPFFFRILFSALFLAGLSIILTWYIFWRANLGDLDKTWNFISEKPLIFSYSSLIIFLAMAVIASITWRVFLTAGLSFAAVSALMYANTEKVASRATPLLPEDLQMADQVGAMTQFVDMAEVTRLVGGIILLLIGATLLDHFARRWIGRDKKQLQWWERFSLIPRVTFTLMSVAALSLAMRPITVHSGTNFSKIEWLDVEFEAWNQTMNYHKNGFVLGFIYNLGSTEVDEPTDYNREHVAEIMAKYEKIKATDDKSRQDLSEVADNIIIVLNESFYDPSLLTSKYPYAGDDLIPNVHAIMKNYLGGYMYSPEYGGGTANVEFEIYTGLTNYWSRTVPYVDILPKFSDIPGIVNYAKQSGFETTAIHAYDRSMYKRNLVYQNLGFDTFIDIDDFKHRERETETSYINDRSIYQEALDIINDSEDSQLIGLVTMQNHTWFNCGAPTDRDEIKILADAPYSLVASYICLQKSDYYLGEFIDELENLDERTVVLWYGDHAAGAINEFFNSEDKLERDLAHLTPYFVYANFELEDLYDRDEVKKINSENGFDFSDILLSGAENSSQRLTAKKLGANISLPTTSPNCLSNTLLDAINAKKPALYYLLGDFCQVEPIFSGSYLGGEDLDSNPTLDDYQLINYDILNGKRYWLEK